MHRPIMLTLIMLRLTVTQVVQDIPHDGSSVVPYALLLLFLAFVAHGTRAGRGAGSAPGRTPPHGD